MNEEYHRLEAIKLAVKICIDREMHYTGFVLEVAEQYYD